MPSSALGVYKPLVPANYPVSTDHSVSDCTVVQDVCSYYILEIYEDIEGLSNLASGYSRPLLATTISVNPKVQLQRQF